jgi:hypothetical protein
MEVSSTDPKFIKATKVTKTWTLNKRYKKCREKIYQIEVHKKLIRKSVINNIKHNQKRTKIK